MNSEECEISEFCDCQIRTEHVPAYLRTRTRDVWLSQGRSATHLQASSAITIRTYFRLGWSYILQNSSCPPGPIALQLYILHQTLIHPFQQPRLLLFYLVSHSTIIIVHHLYKFFLASHRQCPRTERVQVQTRRKASVSACINTHLHCQRQLLLR